MRQLSVKTLLPVLLAAAVAVASAWMALPARAVAVGGARVAAPPDAVRSSRLAGPVRRLLLINGDQLMVRSGQGGRLEVGVRRAAARDALTSLRFGSEAMEIPTDALPYLGRGLSPSLFSLPALEKAESGGRLPVEVAYSGTRPAIPGLTITRSGSGHADGYLTATSAPAFGAALRRQFAADHARGRYGTGLFGRGVSITLAGSPLVTTAARPGYRLHTLTVDATNMRGKPDSGDVVFLGNADSTGRFDGLQEIFNDFYKGATQFSVPAGHYWALATFLSGTRRSEAVHMVVVQQFTVAGRHPTVHISERAATSKVTFRVPQPAVDLQEDFQVIRGDRTGEPDSYSQSWTQGITTWVSPTTRKPTVGTLHAYTSAILGSPAKAAASYAYNLDYPGPAGIIPPQQFTASPARLAAVTERYYQPVPTSSGGWLVFGGTAAQLGVVEWQPVIKIRMPQVQTQYFQAGRDLMWQLETVTNWNVLSGWDSDILRWYTGGQRAAQDWNAFPLHPAPNVTLRGPSAVFPTQPSAFRVGNRLVLHFTPFSDNQFGHAGPGFLLNGSALVTGSYTLDQDGRRIASGSALHGIPDIKLTGRPSVVQFTLAASRHSRFLPLSSGSRTVWTWRSKPDAAARVPRAWYCSYSLTSSSVRFHRQCAVQPLITLTYRVQGMSLAGRTRPGRQVVDVTADHIQLGGSAALTGAKARVSFNDGDSWHPARVTARGGGGFRITYSAPAGADVTLRVSATDAAGGSISETIVRGYGVSK